MRKKVQIEGTSETMKSETSGTESFKPIARDKRPVENSTTLRERTQFEKEAIGIFLRRLGLTASLLNCRFYVSIKREMQMGESTHRWGE